MSKKHPKASPSPLSQTSQSSRRNGAPDVLRAPAAQAGIATPARRRAHWRAAGIGGIAGLLVLSSFAPLGLVPLAWVGVAVLLLAWRASTPFDAWLSGIAFNVVVMLLGGYWFIASLMRLGTFPEVAVLAVSALYLSYQSAMVALVPWIARRWWPRSDALAFLAMVPALWTLEEAFRTFMALGWFSIGYGQVGGPLAGIGPYLGIGGVNFATVLAGGLLALAWDRRRQRGWVPALALALLAATAWGAGRVQWTHAQGAPVRVALVQGNLPHDTDWNFEVLHTVLDMYSNLSAERERESHPDLVVWPETAAPIPYQKIQPFVDQLAAHSQASGTQFVLGTQSRVGQGPDADYYNIALHPGATMEEYRKRQLVPLGEALPPLLFSQATRRRLKADAIAMFSPGAARQPPIRIHGQPIEVAICFESLFGNMLRRMPADTAYLVMITNDELFMGTPMPDQHLQVARMRAIELQRDIARAANSGVSAFIRAGGDVTGRTDRQVRTTLDGTVQPRAGSTPYMRIGDAGALALSALVLALAFGWRRTRGGRPVL